MIMRSNKCMNLKEAAEKLNLAEVTARRWIKTGRLQATKQDGVYGPEYVISPDAVERAKAMNKAPVIIQSNEPAVKIDVCRGLLIRLLIRA